MRIEHNMRDRLLSVENAAEFLGGVSPSTIRGWLTLGKLSRVKVGRRTMLRESELLEFIRTERKAQAK